MQHLEATEVFTLVTYIALYTFFISLLDINQVTEYICKLFHIKLSKEVSAVNDLINERNKLHRERENLSPQDQYAKWTKLGRRIDKLDAEIALKSKTASANKSNLDNKIKMVLKFATKAPQYVVTLWYSRQPVVILNNPAAVLGNSWFSSIFSFFLRFPFGQYDTISGAVWTFAINSVLATLLKSVKSARAAFA